MTDLQTIGRGTQAEVLKAICRGARYPADIARIVGLPVERVYTPLRRLRSAGLIATSSERAPHAYKAYTAVNTMECMLADIW